MWPAAERKATTLAGRENRPFQRSLASSCRACCGCSPGRPTNLVPSQPHDVSSICICFCSELHASAKSKISQGRNVHLHSEKMTQKTFSYSSTVQQRLLAQLHITMAWGCGRGSCAGPA